MCDGCGRCCLNKLEEEGNDADTYYTDVGCRLLDGQTCRCRDYANRLELVDDCVQLTPESLKTINWLPPSCGYVLIAKGKDLYWWHPLVSGDPETVHAAGVSVQRPNERDRRDGAGRGSRGLHRQLAAEIAQRARGGGRKFSLNKTGRGDSRTPGLRFGLLQWRIAAAKWCPATMSSVMLRSMPGQTPQRNDQRNCT